MTILFRPHGDLSKAPFPRSERDVALYEFLSEKTGLPVAFEGGSSVDYEDWMEPAKMLEAAILSGYEVKILPKVQLRRAVSNPVATIPGKPCRDILIGRQLSGDPGEFRYFDLGWPSALNNLSNHYAELSTFRDNSGRRTVLADMPGETNPRLPAFSCHLSMDDIHTAPLGDAIIQFKGGDCIVKQVYPAKSHSLVPIAVSNDEEPSGAEALFIDQVGFHFARFEGDQGSLLVQEKITMTHETRFFVIGHNVICGAACIESDTPQQNEASLMLSDRFEVARNSGSVIHDAAAASALLAFAEEMTRRIRDEAPELTNYVIDLALDEQGRPLIIELNPIAESGLYGIDAQRLFGGIISASEAEPHREPDAWDPADFRGLPAATPARPVLGVQDFLDEDFEHWNDDELEFQEV